MTATIRFSNGIVETEHGVTIHDAVSSAGRYPDTFLYLVAGRPVPMTSILRDGDTVDALKIASGG